MLKGIVEFASNTQEAFVPGKIIVENVLVLAQELVKRFHREEVRCIMTKITKMTKLKLTKRK